MTNSIRINVFIRRKSFNNIAYFRVDGVRRISMSNEKAALYLHITTAFLRRLHTLVIATNLPLHDSHIFFFQAVCNCSVMVNFFAQGY